MSSWSVVVEKLDSLAWVYKTFTSHISGQCLIPCETMIGVKVQNLCRAARRFSSNVSIKDIVRYGIRKCEENQGINVRVSFDFFNTFCRHRLVYY